MVQVVLAGGLLDQVGVLKQAGPPYTTDRVVLKGDIHPTPVMCQRVLPSASVRIALRIWKTQTRTSVTRKGELSQKSWFQRKEFKIGLNRVMD